MMTTELLEKIVRKNNFGIAERIKAWFEKEERERKKEILKDMED